MWTLRRLQNELTALSCVLAGVVLATPADAQFNNNGNVPSYYSSQNYSYGLNLPQVPLPTGQDEIRAADGTACRSNTASNNAYLDMGAIGSQGYGGEFDQGTFYGRVIVPLGDIPKRLDCSSLYNLEIQRLQHELALVRAGAGNLDVVSTAPDAPTIPMKVAGPQPSLVIQKPVAQNTTPSARGKAGGREKAWAEKGWSNSGWQGAAKVGAPTQSDTTAAAPAANIAEPQKVGPQSSVAPKGPTVAMVAEPKSDASTSSVPITTASISAASTSQPSISQPADATVVSLGGAQVAGSATMPVTASLIAPQPVELEVLPWLSHPAIGPRYVTLMTGPSSPQSTDQSSENATKASSEPTSELGSQPASAYRVTKLPARDVSVADMTRNAMGGPY